MYHEAMKTVRRKRTDLARLAKRFHALSDEKRLAIVAQLRHGERCVCELTGALDAGQSLLSFHLKTLKEAGLVQDRRQGRWVYYSLSPETLEEIAEFLGAVQVCVVAEGSGGCCG